MSIRRCKCNLGVLIGIVIHNMFKIIISIVATAAAADGVANQWKFLSSYPRHIAVTEVSDGAITIDGKLNEIPWNTASWSGSFVDITKHSAADIGKVPKYQQAEVAALYDSHYLYVGAKLRDPYTFGNVPMAHNGNQVPYHDNDFEFFIDPSMSSSFYKEFEMNVNNATYDVNWGVPDQAGLNCDGTTNRTHPYLPTCVNTSSPFYNGNWSMLYDDPDVPLTSNRGGLKTATFAPSYGKLNVSGEWFVEIAFPITSDGDLHGGLLDTDSSLLRTTPFFDFSRFDPQQSRGPLYWAADFARTVHPRKFYQKDGSYEWCPFNNCSVSLIQSAVNVSHGMPDAADCAALQKNDPTMLGADPSYGCYWEWVLQNLGPHNAYMHRPLSWMYLEFVKSASLSNTNTNTTGISQICGNIEFPARHLLRSIHVAQVHYKKMTKTYASNVSQLLICPISTCTASDIADLKYAIATPSIFSMSIVVTENATTLNVTCTNRPCYLATVSLTPPLPPQSSSSLDTFQVVGRINENQLTMVERKGGGEVKVPCLF